MIRRLLRRLRIILGRSELDYVIPPEIKDDDLYAELTRIAATPGVRHILEIGASSGAGSTEALVAGAMQNPEAPTIHCLEVSRVRYASLAKRYAKVRFAKCYNFSSVPIKRFPLPTEVAEFHAAGHTNLSRVPLAEVMRWLDQDRQYLLNSIMPTDGIQRVKEQNAIETFDAVLIDGSEFTGRAELDEVYGARFLALDDTRSFKNYDNFKRLSGDPRYRLIRESSSLRNGFAVFERVAGM